jgi:transglutaminase-like putative cysteine protease
MLVRARPDDPLQRVVKEATRIEPHTTTLREYLDGYGNHVWRLTAPTGALTVNYDAVVDVSSEADPIRENAPLSPVDELPDDTLVFTLPSRAVQSDLLLNEAWRLFEHTPPTWQRIQAIVEWVHTNVRYETGSSTSTVTALDVFQTQVGVCRDFALLAVALCRAMNIPARYTFGYLPDIGVEPPDVPMDFHAWFEAYVGRRWYAFDARHNQPRIGRVVVGRGRDVVDVALTTTYGAARLEQMLVWADELAVEQLVS